MLKMLLQGTRSCMSECNSLNMAGFEVGEVKDVSSKAIIFPVRVQRELGGLLQVKK